MLQVSSNNNNNNNNNNFNKNKICLHTHASLFNQTQTGYSEGLGITAIADQNESRNNQRKLWVWATHVWAHVSVFLCVSVSKPSLLVCQGYNQYKVGEYNQWIASTNQLVPCCLATITCGDGTLGKMKLLITFSLLRSRLLVSQLVSENLHFPT